MKISFGMLPLRANLYNFLCIWIRHDIPSVKREKKLEAATSLVIRLKTNSRAQFLLLHSIYWYQDLTYDVVQKSSKYTPY